MPLKLAPHSQFYFMVTWIELQALNQYRLLLEEHLPKLVEERGDLAWDPPRDDDPSDLRLQLIQPQIDALSVQAFRRSFLVCLWAAFESSVVSITKELARRAGEEAPDLAGARDFLRASKKHFEAELHHELLLDGKTAAQVHRLDRIRKAIVHGYATKDSILPSKWEQLVRDADAEDGLDASRGYVHFEAAYLETAFEAVVRVAFRAIEYARERIDASGRR